MADGEISVGMALSCASEMEEPAAKRSKITQLNISELKVTKANKLSCDTGVTEIWEAAVNCLQPAEKEAKPVMAVEQAPASLDGDNNGLGMLLFEPHKPIVKRDDSVVLGLTDEEDAGMKRQTFNIVNVFRREVSSTWFSQFTG